MKSKLLRISIPTTALILSLSFIGTSITSTGAEGDVIDQIAGNNWTGITKRDKDGSLISAVNFAPKSVSELNSFVQDNARFASEMRQWGIDRADIMVTFNKKMTATEFTQWTRGFNATVKTYTFRMVDDKGQLHALGGSPKNGELIPKDEYEGMLGRVQSKGYKLSEPKIVSVLVDAPLSEYDKLSKDNSVALADISSDYVKRGVARRKPNELRGQAQWSGQNFIVDDLEKLGIIPVSR